jgi:hypothetical protein
MTEYSPPPQTGFEIAVTHSPLAYIYALFTPTIEINGAKARKRWGVHFVALAPGDYEVAISYPWLFAPECGRNSVRLSLALGEVKKIRYRAGLIRYLPGKITVGS